MLTFSNKFISTGLVNSFQKLSLNVAVAEHVIKSSNMLLKENVSKSWIMLLKVVAN